MSSDSPILVTGSKGFIGSALVKTLRRGREARPLDLLEPPDAGRGDVRDPATLHSALQGCSGIVHLAAVSRVRWAEDDPALCRATNIGGTRQLLRAAADARPRPWLLLASSREVYGQPKQLPVHESAPLRPLNCYGRSKLEAERLTLEARLVGLRTAVVRLTNVYGGAGDHPDRVVPAFCHGAARGETLRIDGPRRVFDFTHIHDVIRGLSLLMAALDAGEGALPPVHLVSGRPTSLEELALTACAAARRPGGIRVCEPQRYEVTHFHGDPRRAKRLLGWQASVPLAEGIKRLVDGFAIAEPRASAGLGA